MEYLRQLGALWLVTLEWMTGMGISFYLLSRFFPCNPGMHWWKDRRSATADMFYWFLMPMALNLAATGMTLAGAALVFMHEDPHRIHQYLKEGYGPLKDLPIWLQAIMVLILSDIMMYWIHRFFHTRHAWRYHAVHHAPKTLDWTITQRFHPVNTIFYSILANVTMLMLGFSPEVLVALTPFNTLFSAYVHANLNWTFGPLKYVLASPVFHRWHHTGVEEGGMRNFAPTFPVLDIIFGTFYMPKGRLPENYGIGDSEFPESFWGQLAYPFLKDRLAGGRARGYGADHGQGKRSGDRAGAQSNLK